MIFFGVFMKLGIYANWGVIVVDDGFYVEGVHEKYLQQFHLKVSSLTLLSKSKVSNSIPSSHVFVPFKKVNFIPLPDFSSYPNAIFNFASIFRGCKKLLSHSEFIYIRTPEPFGWLFSVLKNKHVLNYHFTSNPLELIKMGMKDKLFLNLTRYFMFYPEFLLLCIAANMNKCTANGNSVLGNIPKFLTGKVKVLVESTTLKSDSPTCNPMLPNDKLKLISVSRLQEGKGIELLIDVFERCLKSFEHSLTLTIVGDGPSEANLKKIVRDKGLEKNISFSGFVSNGVELDLLYRSHNIFINSSFSETGPRTLIEALSNNLYCISSDVGYVDDILSLDKSLGKVIDVNNADALFNALEYVIVNKVYANINDFDRMKYSKSLTLDKFVDDIILGFNTQ
jgi:glycosyltransferase involved in cell wall biosynthesis